MIPGINIVVLDWIIRIIYVCEVASILLLVLRYGNLTSAQKWYLFAIIAHLAAGFTSEFLYRNNINPNYSASVFYILGVALYVGFFCRVMDLQTERKLIYTIAGIHILFSTCNLLWIQKETLNTYSSISLSLVIISLSLLFFYRLLKNLPTDNLLGLPVFWFITAEFMMNVGQMLLQSFAHFLINIFDDNLIVLWVFHHGLGIAGNLFIIYGSWLAFTTARMLPPEGSRKPFFFDNTSSS